MEIFSHSPEQTQQIGALLGKNAQPGDVVLLIGELGSGKTCLTQGIARGLQITEYTSSPTFVLIREYHGRIPLFHIDLYRLECVDEIIELGIEDYLYDEGICVVEWADKYPGFFLPEHLTIRIDYISEYERKLNFETENKRYMEILSTQTL